MSSRALVSTLLSINRRLCCSAAFMEDVFGGMLVEKPVDEDVEKALDIAPISRERKPPRML
jgi:hypothetical protein